MKFKKLIFFGFLLAGFGLENLDSAPAGKMPTKGEFIDYLVGGPANPLLKPEIIKEFKLIILNQAKIFYSFLKKFNEKKKEVLTEKEMREVSAFISQKTTSDYSKIVSNLKAFPQDQRVFLIQSYFAKASREALFDLIGAQIQDKESFVLAMIAVDGVKQKLFQELNDPNCGRPKNKLGF